MVRLAVCGWILNVNICHGIDDTSTTTTKTYHINNLMVLYTRREAFNGWYWIGDGIKDRFNSMALPQLAACGWIFNLNMYCGIDDTNTSTEKVYQINDGLGDILQDRRNIQCAVLNWRETILYTRGNSFNRYWIGDGIKDRFNRVTNIGWFGW